MEERETAGAKPIHSRKHGNEFPQEIVTRQDAARRQLTTAIDLVLGIGDAVSANVLAWSAVEMLRGVAKARGVDTFSGQLEDRIKPEFLRYWRNILKEHYNYFKHADRDPEGVITDFTPESTTWTLFGGVLDYVHIYKTRTWSMLVYQIWFLSRHPEITLDETAEMVSALAPGLRYPAGKPLDEAVQAAFEMVDNGRKHPELLAQLGPAWLKTLEP
ncbi:hypothetical protein [Sphingomonas sp. PWP1-2]|uniref:hypothetical protein n=1 Tax=Sphingomonas sp. PWP1-2 TaxID=2804558 RepID=UPI003CF44459